MADFEKAIKHVLKWEGGYVWHPADPGGQTNRGITDRLDGKVDGLVDVDGDGDGDVTVKHLTEAQARIIYRRRFWDKMQGDKIENQKVADILFDGFVNCGGNGIRLIQRVLNLKEDAVLGPITLNEINNADQKDLFERYKIERAVYYNNLANRKPTLKVFLNGWMNRLGSFNW